MIFKFGLNLKAAPSPSAPPAPILLPSRSNCCNVKLVFSAPPSASAPPAPILLRARCNCCNVELIFSPSPSPSAPLAPILLPRLSRQCVTFEKGRLGEGRGSQSSGGRRLIDVSLKLVPTHQNRRSCMDCEWDIVRDLGAQKSAVVRRKEVRPSTSKAPWHKLLHRQAIVGARGQI